MHASTLLLSALAAFAFAAPTYPQLNVDAVTPAGLDALSDYFNKLAQKVQQSKSLAEAPACDLTKAVLPRQPPCKSRPLRSLHPPPPPPLALTVIRQTRVC